MNMDLSDVDVNVHPNKLTVHFSDENAVEYVVLNAVADALRQQSSPVMESFARPNENLSYADLTAPISPSRASSRLGGRERGGPGKMGTERGFRREH